MPFINNVIVNLSPIGSLADLFVLLESFEVSRFSISSAADRLADFPLDAEIKSFEARMSTFELGNLRTWGWPEDPKYLKCWSWNSSVLANLQESFAEWLNTSGSPCVVWSFFHRLHLKLSIDATQVATENILPIIAIQSSQVRLVLGPAIM
jgi:hypothetical protein